MFFMKLNFDKELMLKAFIVLVIFSFIFSTLWIGMSNSGNDNNNNNNNFPDENNYTLLTGQGHVSLIIKEYSGSIDLDKITEESKEFVNEGVSNGDVLYFNIEPTKVSIILSNKSKTYDYAKILIENDPTVNIILKPRVYSAQGYDFITDSGEIVNAIIPESEIKVSYPYAIGDVLYYNALVQLLNGNVVGAQLYPLAKVEELDMIFLVKDISDEYYSRLYFNWKDRETARSLSYELNESLNEANAIDVTYNYVSDITIYASRALYSEEVELLKEQFSDIKTINMNKIVFYDNSTITEDEISYAVLNATNNSVTLSFSPPMLEIVYKYEGDYNEVESLFGNLNNISISKFHYVKADLHTGDTTVTIANSVYNVPEINLTGFVPTNKKENEMVTLKVSASIQANTIYEVEQVLNFGFE